MRSRMTGTLLLVAIACGASIPAVPQAPPESAANISSASAGMRAYIDPATGQLVPQPAPGRPKFPLARLAPDDSKIEVVQTTDGATGVLFHGQRQATTIATLSKDGSVQTRCIEGTASLPIDAAVAQPKPLRD